MEKWAMNTKKHALIIGGTGMLSGVCLSLAQKGYSVSVIGRTKTKFQRLLTDSPGNSIFPLIADYNMEEVFDEIEQAISERGMFDLIVSWTPNYNTLEKICLLNQGLDGFRLFQVKGSRRYFEDQPLALPATCNYRKVYLGFIIENDVARWLTHDEIADGVIRQIEKNQTSGIIGQINPYESRPR